ncbi:membrane hypothetical protein [Alphaproteobacteria bacterium]
MAIMGTAGAAGTLAGGAAAGATAIGGSATASAIAGGAVIGGVAGAGAATTGVAAGAAAGAAGVAVGTTGFWTALGALLASPVGPLVVVIGAVVIIGTGGAAKEIDSNNLNFDNHDIFDYGSHSFLSLDAGYVV